MEKEKKIILGKIETEKESAKGWLRRYRETLEGSGREKNERFIKLISLVEKAVNDDSKLTNNQKKFLIDSMGLKLDPELRLERWKTEQEFHHAALIFATFINSCH